MLGRVRASSSSPDTLQRPPSKILKDDSLSIYEVTLMKLKLGSRRSLEDPVETESNCSDVNASSEAAILESIHASTEDEAMTIDTNCFSVTSDSRLSACESDTVDSKRTWRKNLSVIHMFSKYNDSRHGLASSCEEETMTEGNDDSASTSSSCSGSLSSSSVCHLILTSRLHLH